MVFAVWTKFHTHDHFVVVCYCTWWQYQSSSVDEDETGPNVFVEGGRLFEELLTLRAKDKTENRSGCFCPVPGL